MLCLIGKTASGKTTIKDYLIKNYNFSGITTYTTRPKRDVESDNTYHYISEKEFNEKILQGFWAEWKKYNTVHGTWYYGTSKESLESSSESDIIILTPDGARDVLKYQKDFDLKIVYIYSNYATIKKRLKKRGDDTVEINRRMEKDSEDFRCATTIADRIVYNNYDDKLENVVQKILKFYKSEMR